MSGEIVIQIVLLITMCALILYSVVSMSALKNQYPKGMPVRYVKLRKDAIEPHDEDKHIAGYELHACIDEAIFIKPGNSRKIGTGIIMEIPEGYYGAIYARNATSLRQGLRPSDCVSIITSDNREEIVVNLYNDSDEIQYIRPSDRIAQLLIHKYGAIDFIEIPSENIMDIQKGAQLII